MEIIIALVAVVVVGALIYFNRSSKGLDVNNDGKVDLADAKAAVENTVEGVKTIVDADGDGEVTIKDAKEVAKKATTGAKKAATTAKTAVKKAATRGRRPKAQ
jgi:hypothetical protein